MNDLRVSPVRSAGECAASARKGLGDLQDFFLAGNRVVVVPGDAQADIEIDSLDLPQDEVAAGEILGPFRHEPDTDSGGDERDQRKRVFTSVGDVDIPGDIETIHLGVAPIVCTWPFNNARPTSLWAAQFSAPYVVAMALMGVPPGPDWFSEDRFSDRAVQALMDRIDLGELDQTSAVRSGTHHISAEATIHTRRGDLLHARVGIAMGEAANPMTREARDRKFQRLARHVLDGAQADELLRTIQNLEKVPTLDGLVKLATPAKFE